MAIQHNHDNDISYLKDQFCPKIGKKTFHSLGTSHEVKQSIVLPVTTERLTHVFLILYKQQTIK